MNFNALQAQIERAMFWTTIAECIAGALGLWLMYWLTKTAVRQGIKESGLIEALQRSRRENERQRDDLPEMRADR